MSARESSVPPLIPRNLGEEGQISVGRRRLGLALRVVAAVLAAYGMASYLIGSDFGGTAVTTTQPYRWTDSPYLLLIDRGNDDRLECVITPDHGKEREFNKEFRRSTLRGAFQHREVAVVPWFEGAAKVRCDEAAAFEGTFARAISYPFATISMAIMFMYASFWIGSGINPGQLITIFRGRRTGPWRSRRCRT